jgi:hypothetical protein
MLNNKCFCCRLWRDLGPDEPKPVGLCQLDQSLTHATYGCRHFRVMRAQLVRNLGVTADELELLKNNPADTYTVRLRTALRAIGDAPRESDPEVKAFLALLDEWRGVLAADEVLALERQAAGSPPRIMDWLTAMRTGRPLPYGEPMTEDEALGLGRNFTGKGC